MLQMSYCGLLCIYIIYIIYIYLYTHTYICVCVVELRAPAMPFGLEAFVAVKLRSLIGSIGILGKLRVTQSSRGRPKVRSSPWRRAECCGQRKRGGQIANMCVHITSVEQKDVYG